MYEGTTRDKRSENVRYSGSGRGGARPALAGGRSHGEGQHDAGGDLPRPPAPALRELAGRSLTILPQAAFFPCKVDAVGGLGDGSCRLDFAGMASVPARRPSGDWVGAFLEYRFVSQGDRLTAIFLWAKMRAMRNLAFTTGPIFSRPKAAILVAGSA